MKNKNLKCPHCEESSIELSAIKNANWDNPCICPSCNNCCNSRRFILFLITMLVYFVFEPIVLLFSFLYFGWEIALALAISVGLLAYYSYNFIETKLHPVKVLCNSNQ